MLFNDLVQHQIPFFIRLTKSYASTHNSASVEPVYVNGKPLRRTVVVPHYRQFEMLPQWGLDDPLWRQLYWDSLAIQTERPAALITGLSAAKLLGLPVRAAPEKLHLAVPSTCRVVSTPGTRTARSAHYVPVEAFGLRFQQPLLVLLSIALELTEHELILCLEAMLGSWRSRQAFTKEQATTTLQQLGKVKGKMKLLGALKNSRENVGSPGETALRLKLIAAGLPEPEVQHPVWIPELDRFLHPDLAYPRFRIIIEYEGDHHRTDEVQYNRDIARYRYFTDNGWRVFRVTRKTSIPLLIQELATLMHITPQL